MDYNFIELSTTETEINVLSELGNSMIKDFYMESASEEYNIPDPTNKWNMFKNWISRVINTIISHIKSKEYKNNLEKCKNLDYSIKTFHMNSQDKFAIERLLSDLNKKEYDNINLNYNKKFRELYIEKQRYYQKMISDLNKYKTYESNKISLKNNEIKKYIKWIETSGKKIAEKLPTVNHQLKDIQSRLTDEERKDESFRQYIQMITYMLQMDLMIVKFIIIFMKNVYNENTEANDKKVNEKYKAFKQTPTNEEDPSMKDGNLDKHKFTILNEAPECIKNAVVLNDINLNKGIKSIIKIGAVAYLGKKYPKCKRFYAHYNKSTNKIEAILDTNEKTNGDWRIRAYDVDGLNEVKGLNPKAILNAFEATPCAYLDR